MNPHCAGDISRKPAAVIFTFIQTEEGGDLILVQTPIGHYTYDHIARAVHVFAKIAGIKITRS